MSRYTIRHVEGRFSTEAGAVYELSELPDASTVAEGTEYRIYNKEKPYVIAKNGQWKFCDKCPSEWRLLPLYSKCNTKPARARYKDENGEWKYYEKENPNYREYQSEDGDKMILHKRTYFCNNGGAIRDDYISTSWCNNVFFAGRGFPDDMAEETRKSIYDEDDKDEEGNIKFYGYDRTWVLLSEWDALYDTEQEKILKKIAEAYEKKHHDNINKKLDFIIHNMKDPMNANFDELNEKEVDDDGNEICDEYSYYDSPEYIIEEEMPKLYQIAEEIGKIASIADYYNIYSREDIRIIYYIE